MKLVHVLYEQLSFEIWEKKNFARRNGQPVNRRETPVNALAGLLGVHRNTVSRWINKGYQACNANADKLLLAVMDHCPERALSLLEEDMETHRLHFNIALSETHHGGGATQRSEVVL